MDESLKKVTLDTVSGGVAGEKFDVEHQKVLENLLDPNTPVKGKRKVVLEFVYEMDDDRTAAKVFVKSKAVLVPDKPVSGVIYIGRRDGQATSLTQDLRQGDLWDQEDEDEDEDAVATEGDGVVSIDERRVKG